MTEYILLGAIGFLAQMIDGALGMAFGVVSTTAMLSMGMPPAQASAIVHTAEIFTTGASATSHYYHRNIDWRLVIRLGIAGVAGAILGAWVLSNVDAAIMRPFVAAYLILVGIFILLKAWKTPPGRDAPAPWVGPIGFVAGFLDASGGGGWGPVTTSALIGSGHAPRLTVGFGQRDGVFRHRRGGDDVLCRTRRVAVEGTARAGRRRHARGAARRLDGEARLGADTDGRGRLSRDCAVNLADRAGGEAGVSCDARYWSLLRPRLPRVFELHGDEVGCAHSVAGRDFVKGLVQCLCRLPIPDRRKQPLRGPAGGDLIRENADAVAGLLRTGSAGERHRA